MSLTPLTPGLASYLFLHDEVSESTIHQRMLVRSSSDGRYIVLLGRVPAFAIITTAFLFALNVESIRGSLTTTMWHVLWSKTFPGQLLVEELKEMGIDEFTSPLDTQVRPPRHVRFLARRPY